MTKSSDYAIITGASSGIGRAMALSMARAGHNLLLTARNKASLKKLCDELADNYDIKAEYIAADLTKDTDMDRFLREIERRGGHVTHLINNAGVGDYSAVIEADMPTLESMMQLNMVSLVRLCRELAPRMPRGGRIMNVASVAAFFPGPKMAVYHSTKSFVLHFSLALGYELKSSGISVSTLCPGPTKTAFAQTANAQKLRLFQRTGMTAERVAHVGLRGLKKRRSIIVVGFKNKLLVQLRRFLPQRLITHLVARSL